MNIAPFALERYFAKYEFSARYLLSSSDCEPLPLVRLLQIADDECGRLWDNLKLGYTESTGHPLLRQEISETYTGINPEETLVLAPEEGIFLLMHALLQPGDHVISTFPGYQSLYEVARSIGCTISTWLPDEDRGWAFAVEKLQSLLRTDTKLVVVNFPHNPTGYLPSLEVFEAIIDLARSAGAYLLSDEMYRHLEMDDRMRLPAACENSDKAISLSGLSKAYGLPGLRIGWLASRDRSVLEQVSRLKDYTTICSSAPSEILAIIGLRNRSAILGDQTARVRRNLTSLHDFVDSRADKFQINWPLGGSICFPRMLAVEDTDRFCEGLVSEAGIMLLPSSQFQYGSRHVRVGFGRQDFPEVLERFGQYLDRH